MHMGLCFLNDSLGGLYLGEDVHNVTVIVVFIMVEQG